jgi:hypothetical protein
MLSVALPTISCFTSSGHYLMIRLVSSTGDTFTGKPLPLIKTRIVYVELVSPVYHGRTQERLDHDTRRSIRR